MRIAIGGDADFTPGVLSNQAVADSFDTNSETSVFQLQAFYAIQVVYGSPVLGAHCGVLMRTSERPGSPGVGLGTTTGRATLRRRSAANPRTVCSEWSPCFCGGLSCPGFPPRAACGTDGPCFDPN